MIKIKNASVSKNRWMYPAIPLSSVSKDYIEKSITGDNLVTRGYQSRHKLWPIPGQEIEMNPALLPQNQDW